MKHNQGSEAQFSMEFSGKCSTTLVKIEKEFLFRSIQCTFKPRNLFFNGFFPPVKLNDSGLLLIVMSLSFIDWFLKNFNFHA